MAEVVKALKRKLEQEPMYRSLLFCLLAGLLFFACATKKPIVVYSKLFTNPKEVVDSINSEFPKFSKLSALKSRLILDYEGNMRSLKTTISTNIDSFTYINLTTPFGQPVAILYADNDFIYFIDHQEQTIHKTTYITLSKKLKVYLSHREIQNFIFASPQVDYNTYETFLKQTSYSVLENRFETEYPISFERDTVKLNFSLKNVFHPQYLHSMERSFNDSRNRTLIQARYIWSSKVEEMTIPQRTIIEFNYEGNEVEVDFDFKSINFNSIIPFTLDSTYTLNILK